MSGQKTSFGRDSTLLRGSFWLRKGLHWANKQPGATTLTWQEAAPVSLVPVSLPDNIVFEADPGIFVIDGVGSLFIRSYPPVSADYGAFSIEGQEATLTYGKNVQVSPGSVVVDVGDASLARTQKLLLVTGSVAVDVFDVGFRVGYTIFQDPGDVPIQSPDAYLRHGHLLAADSEQVLINGSDAGVIYGYGIKANNGSFDIVGDTDFARHYVAKPVIGEYQVDGSQASLEITNKLEPWSGSFLVSGPSALLKVGRSPLGAEPGSILTEFADAALKSGKGIASDSGEFNVIGEDAEFSRLMNYYLGAYPPASIEVEGIAANLSYYRVFDLIAESGGFDADGVDSSLLYHRRSFSEEGYVNIEDFDGAGLYAGLTMYVDSGSYYINGGPSSLVQDQGLQSSSFRRSGANILSLKESQNSPSAISDVVRIYSFNTGGVTQLAVRSSDGNIHIISNDQESIEKGIYGDGKDGAVVFSSTTTLTGDVYATTVHVSSGVSVNTAGYRIFATETITNQGIIHNNGRKPVGFDGSGTGAYGAVYNAGQDGGSGTIADGVSPGQSGTNLPLGYNGYGGMGGFASGNSGGYGGEASLIQLSDWRQSWTIVSGKNYYLDTFVQLGGAPGGGGGAGNGTLPGAAGGGGGGIVVLCAKQIINSGSIQSRGGDGGDAVHANTGGGGGGAGGVVFLITDQYSGSNPNVFGGAAGASLGASIEALAGTIGMVIGPISG